VHRFRPNRIDAAPRYGKSVPEWFRFDACSSSCRRAGSASLDGSASLKTGAFSARISETLNRACRRDVIDRDAASRRCEQRTREKLPIFRLAEVATKPFLSVTTVHGNARHRLLNKKCCQISKASDNFLTLPCLHGLTIGADSCRSVKLVAQKFIVNLKSLST